MAIWARKTSYVPFRLPAFRRRGRNYQPDLAVTSLAGRLDDTAAGSGMKIVCGPRGSLMVAQLFSNLIAHAAFRANMLIAVVAGAATLFRFLPAVMVVLGFACLCYVYPRKKRRRPCALGLRYRYCGGRSHLVGLR